MVYLTVDGGATWTDVTSGASHDNSSAPWSATRTPHWIGDIDLDPFNADRAMFITGYGVWACDDLVRAESGQTVHWEFRNAGLEETVPLVLASPPSGAPLISAIGDQGGFFHHDLDASPPLTDLFPTHRGTHRGLDVAWLNPDVIVRLFEDGTRGAYTLDGGASWTDFPTAPAATTTNGPGAIAASADGTRFVWMPDRAGAFVSTNHGTTWTPGAGSPSNANESLAPIADRVNPGKFYIYDRPAGRVHVSTDGGESFSTAAVVPAWGNPPRAVPGFEGHLWLPVWDNGLRRSIDSGASFISVPGVQRAFRLGFGRAAPGAAYPAIYLWGQIDGVEGFHRSNDEGATWTRLNDGAHRFGWINDLTGDPRIYGRIYLATGGRGILYGEPPPVMPAGAFAAFSAGVAGSFIPEAGSDLPVTFSATGLPAWAVFDTATGSVSGTPTDSAGTVHQITLHAISAGDPIGSSTLNLLVAAAGTDLRVINLSARAQVGTGGDVLIPGFVVGGSGPRELLIRAVGPTLAPLFGVPGALADPALTLLDGQTPLLANDNWEDNANLAAVVAAMNTHTGFSFASGSRDAVLLTTLQPGLYTARTEGVAGTTGNALVEVYDTTVPGANDGRLVNISARAVVGTGDNVLIPGLILEGGGATRVLVRAVGPTLEPLFGLSGVLADPVLTLFSGSTPLATNDDWGDASNADEIRAVTTAVFAFDLPEGSRDAVLLPTLVQGAYTLKVSGRNGATGIALVELYVVP